MAGVHRDICGVGEVNASLVARYTLRWNHVTTSAATSSSTGGIPRNKYDCVSYRLKVGVGGGGRASQEITYVTPH